jgi:hypothetical protein
MRSLLLVALLSAVCLGQEVMPTDMMTETMKPTDMMNETMMPTDMMNETMMPNRMSAMHFTVSENGVNFLKDYALAIIMRNLTDLQINNFEWDQNGFSGTVSNIHCKDLVFGTVNSSLHPGIGARYAGNGLGIKCSANWDYKANMFPHLPTGDGTLDVNIADAFVAMIIQVREEDMKPVVSAVNATCSINTMDIEFSGGLTAMLLNLIKGLVSVKLRENVEGAVSGAIFKIIDKDVNKVISQRDWFKNLDLAYPNNVSTFLYGLTSNPMLETNYLAFPLQGYTVNREHLEETAPIPMTDLTFFDPSYAFEDIQIILSPYVPQSLYWVYWKANRVHHDVTAKKLPMSLPWLNTTTLSAAVPALMDKYPPHHQMNVVISANGDYLNASSNPMTGATFSVPYYLDFRPAGDNMSSAVMFECVMTGRLFLGFEHRKNTNQLFLIGNITYVDCPLEIVNNSVGGNISIDHLQRVADNLLMDVTLPYLNEFLMNGVPIPNLDGLTFKDAMVKYGDNYVLIGANFTYDLTQIFGPDNMTTNMTTTMPMETPKISEARTKQTP